MDSPILQYNNIFKKTESGIWRIKDKTLFNYSDTDEVEENLKEIVRSSDDRTALSNELEDKIFNWASEYHLSYQRANLFRFLDLDKIDNILELGCGCGAITRFLGESKIQIDAVEGSDRRAQISRDRCMDLKNVHVICSNFNDLKYPEDSYDCVSLVGVLEYAKKYNKSSKDDEHAVHDILSKAKITLKKKGLLIISIENRMGLKYWLGASEDHLGKPYAGLYGYPNDIGIKTYTKREWEKILNQTGFEFYRFCYPFPDYKLPRIIITDHFLENDRFSYSLLYRVESRDYDRVWRPEANEYLIWKSLCQSSDAGNYANSFFIIASTSPLYLEKVIPNDFMQFPDPGRKEKYRTITYKPKGSSYVYKKPLKASTKKSQYSNRVIVQNEFKRTKYLEGELLSTVWLTSIEENQDDKIFLRLLQDYYSYLTKTIDLFETKCKLFDLLPSNIIVGGEGEFDIIDQEWIVYEKINHEFIFFRALFWFTIHNKFVISKFVKQYGLRTVDDFIKYCFDSLSIKYERSDYFLILEEKFHREIVKGFKNGQLEQMLHEPITYEENIKYHHGQDLKDKIEYLSSEIEVIKNSNTWRLAVFLRRLSQEKLLNRFPLLHKGALYLIREGARPFLSKTILYIANRLQLSRSIFFRGRYNKWILKNEIKEIDIPIIKKNINEMKIKPLISVVMPVYNVNGRWLEMAIRSVVNQIYEKWELCIVDDGSTRDNIKEIIETYKDGDDRIKAKYLKENQGISAASNEALSIASGDFIALLDHDDELSKDAFYEVIKLINKYPDAQMIYSDEDMIDENGMRMNPYFKPDWSPDTILSGNYITHLSVFKSSIVDRIGGFRRGYEGSQDFDLTLRFTEIADKIYHVPKILYHWRKIDGSVAALSTAKNYAYENAKKALEDALRRRRIRGRIELGHGSGYYIVRREVDFTQLISIVVLSLKPGKSLYHCIKSIIKKTRIQNYEIVVQVNEENSYTEKVKKDYNNCRIVKSNSLASPSEAYNQAVEHTKGKHLLFLNDTMEIVSSFWLQSMLEQSQRPEIGAVGSKILYPNKRQVFHAGKILGVKGLAGNAYNKMNDKTEHYFGHLNIIKNYSAVSGSCMMIKSNLFKEVHGFDSINLPFLYSDIDLCLRIERKGFRNLYTPFSVLSKQKSGNYINDFFHKSEKAYMLLKWGERIKEDPYYNPNLTLSRENFSIRL